MKFVTEGSIIRNEELLEENHKTEDLLDFSFIIENFKAFLKEIKKNSIIGLIGKFGSGKSTMLYQIYKDLDAESDDKWIIFDAWKYPERNNLWEGFVLDFADQVGKKKEAQRKIDGKQVKSAILDIGTDLLSRLSDNMPDLNFLDKFGEFFKKSPATRIFEIQIILKEMISKLDKDVFIIVEDIDRSSDKGIFFLETLRDFIKENKFDHKIIVIVPIGDKQYLEVDEARDSYLKILDYTFNFNPGYIDFKNFIDNIFIQNLCTKCQIGGIREEKSIFIEQLNYLFRKVLRKKDTSIRELKHVLRLTNIEYSNLTEVERSLIDIRILILIKICNYVKDFKYSNIDNQRKLASDFWARDFLMMVANDKIDLKGLEGYSNKPFFLVENPNFIIPQFLNVFEYRNSYCLSDKYLEFLD
jgi:GTPase SAR1 family protein